MKTRFTPHVLVTLAVALAGAVSLHAQTSEITTTSLSANGSALPPEIQPGTPTAEVVKMVQAGVDAGVIKTYISNSTGAFNLNADKIIALSDAGLPGDVINDMIAHDKNYLASLSTASPEPTPETQPDQSAPVVASSDMQPAPEPTAPVTVNYFYDNLSPYGTWVDVEGYGRCWRPNVVLYDATWRPYCDRGHWVYTDCGWYWDSDYSWGVTFHYGRWFNSSRYGWCWWPDTVWAPSWVTWRSTSDYCGWAPLPPLTIYQPGIGFCYRGKNVAIGFDFGLASSCFTFVTTARFCDPHPRYYCVPANQVNQFYHQTTIVNNFNCNNNRMINNGVSVTIIGHASSHPIQAVSIGSLVNPGRRGWHGAPSDHHYYGSEATGHSDSHSYNVTGFNDNHRQFNSTHHDNNKNYSTGNDNHQFRNDSQYRPPTTPTYNHDRNQNFLGSRDNNSFSRPASPPTNSRQTKQTQTAAPNPSRNNGSYANNQSHQTVQPVSPREYSNDNSFRANNSSSWNNRNVTRNESHSAPERQSTPHYDAPVNNRPATIGQGSQRNNSQQNFVQTGPRANAPQSSHSTPSPQRNQRQQIGGPRDWLSQNH